MLLLTEFEVKGKEITQTDDNKNTDYTDDKTPEENSNQKTPDDLKPADPTGNDAQPNENTENQDNNDDMTIPADATSQEDSQTAEAEGEQPTDNNPDNNSEGGQGSTDYTTDAGEDTGTDYTDTGDGGTGDTEGDAEPDDAGTDDMGDTENQDNDEIRQIETELFSNLSPEQIMVKSRELKHQYIEVYDVTTSLIDKINDITKTDEVTRILSFTSEKLSDLRTMIVDYIDSVFDTVTYMENAITYNKYLAVLTGINKIIEQISLKPDQK